MASASLLTLGFTFKINSNFVTAAHIPNLSPRLFAAVLPVAPASTSILVFSCLRALKLKFLGRKDLNKTFRTSIFYIFLQILSPAILPLHPHGLVGDLRRGETWLSSGVLKIGEGRRCVELVIL